MWRTHPGVMLVCAGPPGLALSFGEARLSTTATGRRGRRPRSRGDRPTINAGVRLPEKYAALRTHASAFVPTHAGTSSLLLRYLVNPLQLLRCKLDVLHRIYTLLDLLHPAGAHQRTDRKSTRLNSSHL